MPSLLAAASAPPAPLTVRQQGRMAIPWTGGCLALMLLATLAGRQATRALDMRQTMLMRSLMGQVLSWPLVDGQAVPASFPGEPWHRRKLTAIGGTLSHCCMRSTGTVLADQMRAHVPGDTA